MYSDKQRDNDKYTEKGVEDEAGSRRFNESDESSDEDESKDKNKEGQNDKEKAGVETGQADKQCWFNAAVVIYQ